ncbi:universal stress protein [Desulfobacterales bacterium HSG16]|nr:universal stress protein [Desulfobacterales bacterium HSG16]
MAEIKKILVAIGVTQFSQDTFEYGAKLAQALNADITIVSIINSRDVEAVGSVVSLGYEVDGEHYVQSVKAERKENIKKIIEDSAFPEKRVEIVLKVGNPIDEILDIIIDREIDMVVMGPKGRTNLEHILIGSLAEKIFRRSPAVVVSYRNEEQAESLKKRIRRRRRNS